MRSRLTTLLTVLGAVTVLVLAGNTVALAATGKGFLLGKTNTTSKATTLKRTTPGAALKVTTKKSTDAPFSVNGRGRVANLNADTVDGLDATSFATRYRPYVVRKTISTPTNSFFIDAPASLPPGYYMATYSMELQRTNGADIGYVRCLAGGTGPGGSTELTGATFAKSAGESYVYLTGSGLVYKPKPNFGVNVQCYGPSGVLFNTPSPGLQPIQLVLQRVEAPIASTDD